MGITKKGKRKIVIDRRTYFWRGFNELDQTSFDGDQIQLIAADQSHTISYGLQQNDGERFVLIRLRNDQGSVCLECPKCEGQNGIITPSGIRKLVDGANPIHRELHTLTIQDSLIRYQKKRPNNFTDGFMIC